MVLYKDAEQRKEILKDFIRKNPSTTHREIRKRLHIKTERVYSGGMTEAFMDAGVSPPRTFEMKTKETRKKILIDYLRKNPNVGMHIVNKNTKINYNSVFKNVLEFYKEAGVSYLRNKQITLQKRTKNDRIDEIIKLVRENPSITVDEIMKLSRVHFYRMFKNIDEVYNLAGINYIKKDSKRKLRKREEVINYVRNNPLATQREINKACKTHVQLTFNKGIFDAYREAGIEFPYERLNLHGSAIRDIKNRAKNFEDEIAIKLSGYGVVHQLVKTKRGFADIIIERKNKKAVVEVKDYLIHEISISQINQLNKYLEDCNCNIGFLVCKIKPSKDRFLIGENPIHILTADELNKIPEVIDSDL